MSQPDRVIVHQLPDLAGSDDGAWAVSVICGDHGTAATVAKVLDRVLERLARDGRFLSDAN